MLREADYYELDCSFKSMKPHVHSISLAVKANAGIPLGNAIAPSDKREFFSSFADLLAENGFARDELFQLPLLSDAARALRSYADGRAGRAGYHQRHYLCY
jgi:hypothetical protein